MMDRLCQKLSRIVAVCVVAGSLLTGVCGGETINAQSTTAKTIDVSASDQKLIFSSSGSLNVGGARAISFSPTGTGAGKIFTITNSSSVDPDSSDTSKKYWLISATNGQAEDNMPCNASAIDLTGICGADGKQFTISLPTTDKIYSFSAEANKADAGVTCATVIGVPQVQSTQVDYVKVDTKEGQAKLKFAATATGSTTHSGAAVFGVGWANVTSEVMFANWTIGDISADSELSASAEGGTYSNSYSTIFGAGRANGKISLNYWKIGTIGERTKLTSQSKYSTIFGAGYAYSSGTNKVDFKDWNVGKIETGANLSSKSTVSVGASSGASSIVGPAYAKSTASNDGLLDFSGLEHGGAEAGVTMTSESTGTGNTYSAVFGAGYAEGSVSAKEWTIGTIGGTTGSDDATTLSSKGKYSSVFGAGYAKLDKENATLDFSGWKIGNLDTGSPQNSIGNNVTITSEGEYATIFGAGYAKVQGDTQTTGRFGDLVIGNIGEFVWLKSVSTSDEVYQQKYCSSSVFGAGYVSGNVDFQNWMIGNIGQNSNLMSTARFESANPSKGSHSYASIFGIADSYIDCNQWQIGNIGCNVTLTSCANCTCSGLGSAQFDASSSIFGAGHAKKSIVDWTVGNVGSNVVLTSNAVSVGISRTSVFGVAYQSADGISVKNWTAEFQGNAVVASLGYATKNANCHISTFGGAINGGDAASDGMRFYFNGKQKPAEQTDNPVVTIGALKLAGPWEVFETTGKTATATIAGGEDWQKDARAFGIGPNFQINVGRARTLEDTKQDNGTFESNESITSGGTTSSPITMNILGEIRAATGNIYDQGNVNAGGSVMRIDGGSTVNCFRPVQDLSKIEIINGTMNLMGNNAADQDKLTKALQHLQANISYSRAITEDFTDENGQTVQKTKTELYQNAAEGRDGRDGNVKLTSSGYPINGELTVGSGQTLAFGVDLNAPDDSYDGFKKTYGVLNLPSTGGRLILNNGGMLGIDDAGGQNKLDEVPANANFYVVQTGYYENASSAVEFLQTNYSVDPTPYVFKKDDGAEINLYRIAKSDGASIISTGNDEYTYWDGLHAYVINDKTLGGGIVIGTGGERFVGAGGRPPATKKPTDYAKDFASEELASIDAEIMNDIQRHILFAEMCSYKQDPFLIVLGGHGHQDEILGYGYDYDKYGIVIGHDFVKELSNGGNLKFGGLLGYCHANIDFFGNATSRSKHAGKDMYNIGIFGMYKNDNSKHMHTRFHVFGGFAYVENEMSRVDSNNAHFNTKFDSNDINVSAEWMKGMVRLCGLEVGPWAGVTYNRIHQKSYHENGGRNAASLDAVDFDMLDTILGLYAEKIFHHKENDKKYLHLVLRAGWKCQPIRSHSHCLARLDDAGIAPFVPVFGYTDKHSGILYGGLKNKISDNISISGGIGSTISHDHWNISGHVALNYYY